MSQFVPRRSVLSSLDLVDKFEVEKTSMDCELISFDVKSLFPNVPLGPTILYTRQLISKVNVHSSNSDEFVKLLNILLKNNVCFFRGAIYKFPRRRGGVHQVCPLIPL